MTFPEKTSLRPSMYLVLIFTAIIGYDMLSNPLVSVKALGNSGYFAPLAAAVPVIAIIIAMFALQKRFPGKSGVQCASLIIGNVPAVIINLLLIIFWRVFAALSARNIMTLVSTQMLLKTPLWFFSTIGYLGIMYLAYHGIESISRFVAFTFIPATIIIIIVFCAAFPYIDIRQLLPVLDFSITDLIKGAFSMSYLYFPLILLFLITPYTKKLPSARRFTMAALALSVLVFLIQNICAIGIFGTSGLNRYTWPTLEFAHVINIRYIALEQIGVVLLTVWLVLTFGAAAFNYWGTALALSQLFPKISYKMAVLILALPTGLVLLLPQNIIDTRFYLLIFERWGVLAFFGHPLILWLIAVIRRQGKES
ncbi:MAG TPA: hypothetical protein DCY85_05645 [Firmicutes bacterium]|nr:hypothetical protein [Bacillota bacterium]